MNTVPSKFAASIAAMTLVWSSAGYAGCNPAQVSGVWEAAFSDGNSCKLKLNNRGAVVAKDSVCFDPNRGSTTPDSGQVKTKGDCFAEGELVVEGVTIELPVQFDVSRSLAAGRYRVSIDGSKGSVVMVRKP